MSLAILKFPPVVVLRGKENSREHGGKGSAMFQRDQEVLQTG